jgi:hypothetical protein
MQDKYIPLEEYIALWEDCKTRMCLSSPGIDPTLKHMTVIGQSGEGTKFKNEYDRMMYNYLNPPMPRCINWHGAEGTYTIHPVKNKK